MVVVEFRGRSLIVPVIGLRVRGAGRTPAAHAFDAMIAAIAISNDLPLHTCNPRDFAGIEELTVVAVPHPHH